jgi:hypothetical protein
MVPEPSPTQYSKLKQLLTFLLSLVLGLKVRTAMLGPDPSPLQVAYWKLPTQPQRLTKGQLLTFISLDGCQGHSSRDSNLTTAYLSWLPSNSIP